MLKRLAKLSIYPLAWYLISVLISSWGIGTVVLPDQNKQDVKAFIKSSMNATLTLSVYDYITELRGLEYNTPEYVAKRSIVHSRVAKRILYLSEKNRGIYLKAGQYISTLERMMPKEYIEVLKVLQDSGPSLPYDEIKIVFETDFNTKIEDVFVYFEKNAVASASLAQVHRAQMKDGRMLAIKLQFPFLRVQTVYDMLVLRSSIRFANKLLQYYDYKGLDLGKFYLNFEKTITEELDFTREVTNADITRELFRNYKHLHIPEILYPYCGRRVITMEYIDGLKINDVDKLRDTYGNVEKIGDYLIDVFGKMIFIYGHVHCDAHPGNILVRPQPGAAKVEPQIVLLDHGFYCKLDDFFRTRFCEMWYSMVTFDNKTLKNVSRELGIGEYWRYLPVLFTYRTINSKKKLGSTFTKEEFKFMAANDEVNFEKISFLLQYLPADLTFIFRATSLVGHHNAKLDGTTRKRFKKFTDICIDAMAESRSLFYFYWIKTLFYVKMFLFEYAFYFYNKFFGFYEVKFDENKKLIDDAF